jgi:hypothetical protein
MATDTEINREQLLQAVENLSLLSQAMAEHAADIAHARRTLFEAHIAEGFTPEQAIILCMARLS